ncbi:peptidyl-prolyl cis-trans isomerase B (cyclophilin B) [Nonomuraea solani]|uniref:Peptidyl-prolyl cis-trans isomerase B (Cyclophilin B) n=1 Tax=Nonomuraea solani TaxID=1144553 RepID=A0A1H6DZX9_9ACTN|nr:peptidylprolyl isomerase [Nonomuraea solani]SEG90679.1 peptidyl-prolyl cis-trans isomerase B (cyclophilin B) [Nonomuraea solani]
MATGKDRQKQLAREHYERQMQRRVEREQKAKRTAIIGSTVGVVIVVGGIVAAVALLGGNDPATEAAASPSATPADTTATTAPPATGPKPYNAATGTCDYAKDTGGGQVKDVGTPPAKVKTEPATKTMTLKTNQGDIVVELNNAKAPCTTNSLEFLAKKNYYKGSKCHRLGSDKFPMLQCGDPTAKADGKSQDGSGGPGYVMAEENLQGAQYKRGVMAMAKTQAPGSTGSQFFLVYGDIGLTPDYTPVGTITKGLDILDKVNKAGVIGDAGDGTGAPKQSVEIKDVTIAGKS